MDLSDQTKLTYLFRLIELDGNLLTINRFNETFQVAPSALFRNPARLFRVIRLGLELNLKEKI